MGLTKIKICGLKSVRDAEAVNGSGADFAGVVMFCPKSRRNTEPETAGEIVAALEDSICPVAVMAEPDAEQIDTAARLGFVYVQIHGTVTGELIESSPLPVIKAFNCGDADGLERYGKMKNIVGYVFDAAEPGSGKTFDWDEIPAVPRDGGKLYVLAGGLCAGNAAEAVRLVSPDVADVSSGVENEDGDGKSRGKILEFIAAVRAADRERKLN